MPGPEQRLPFDPEQMQGPGVPNIGLLSGNPDAIAAIAGQVKVPNLEGVTGHVFGLQNSQENGILVGVTWREQQDGKEVIGERAYTLDELMAANAPKEEEHAVEADKAVSEVMEIGETAVKNEAEVEEVAIPTEPEAESNADKAKTNLSQFNQDMLNIYHEPKTGPIGAADGRIQNQAIEALKREGIAQDPRARLLVLATAAGMTRGAVGIDGATKAFLGAADTMRHSVEPDSDASREFNFIFKTLSGIAADRTNFVLRGLDTESLSDGIGSHIDRFAGQLRSGGLTKEVEAFTAAAILFAGAATSVESGFMQRAQANFPEILKTLG